MMNSYDSSIIPIISSFTDRAYIRDIDGKRPEKLLDDIAVRNKIDDYRITGNAKTREQLIYAFGNFVVSIAKNYQGNGLPICDLIGEGMIGLLSSIEKYDTTNATKFITYAGVVISRQIREALDQFSLPVRVPKNIRNTMHKVKSRSMSHSLGGVTPEERYEEFDSKERVFIDRPFMYQKVRIRTEQEDENELVDSPTTKHIDLIQVTEEQPDAELVSVDLSTELHKVMKSKLTKIELKVIRMYYGINRKYPMNSVKEIGRILHISGERARQLRDAALKKLSTPAVKSLFIDYI
jgi:RNA polymerase primary sigma factor